jgi:hypothetical protein
LVFTVICPPRGPHLSAKVKVKAKAKVKRRPEQATRCRCRAPGAAHRGLAEGQARPAPLRRHRLVLERLLDRHDLRVEAPVPVYVQAVHPPVARRVAAEGNLPPPPPPPPPRRSKARAPRRRRHKRGRESFHLERRARAAAGERLDRDGAAVDAAPVLLPVRAVDILVLALQTGAVEADIHRVFILTVFSLRWRLCSVIKYRKPR